MTGTSDSMVSYLRQADTTFRNKFATDEMKTLFLENVFDEIAGCELNLIVRKSTSSILENLVSSASAENLLQLLKVCQVNLVEILESSSGCHVFKKSLKRLIVLLENADSKMELWTQLINVVISCCKFLNSDDDLIEWMTNYSQVFQFLVSALGGSNTILSAGRYKSQEHNKNKSTSTDMTLAGAKLPEIFLQTFENLVSSFTALEKGKIVELLNHDKAAPCICCMLKVASLRSTCQDLLCNKLLTVCQRKDPDDWRTLIVLTKDKIASHVIDTLLESNHKPTCVKLLEILASNGSLIELACHSVANFVVQKLIVMSVSNDQFVDIFKALIDNVEDILAEENFGILQKLAEQCLHVKSCQKKLLEALLKTFHCTDENQRKYIVPLIASYSTYEMLFQESDHAKVSLDTITYHGSLLLQTLLQFDNPVTISDSLATIPVEHIKSLACDVSGSHIIDAFFNSNSVQEIAKMNFIKHARGQFHVLARDKYGNKVLWNMWTKSSTDMKIAISESLVNHEDLKTHQYGKYVLIHFRLRDFVEKRQYWLKFQEQQVRKRKVFEEFLNTDSGAKGHKSKTKKQS